MIYPIQYKQYIRTLIFTSTLIFILFQSSCSKETHEQNQKVSSRQTEQQIIANKASEILTVLKNKDMKKFATFIHPRKGVRFSPYAFVDIKHDLVFLPSKVRSFAVDTTIYNWGSYDATGKTIRLKFLDFYQQFIFDHDYLTAKEIGYQKVIGQGNTKNNISDIYPDAIFIEYHFPGFDQKYFGMDWVSLRLVFEKWNNTWYLVGIIHDQWTS